MLFFWIGLGLTNHHTLIFYALPAALFVLRPGDAEPRRIGMFRFAVCVASSPTIYLPIASARDPLDELGRSNDGRLDFLNHLLRREYGTFRWGFRNRDRISSPGCAAYISGAFADLLWIVPDPGDCGSGAVGYGAPSVTVSRGAGPARFLLSH